MFSLTINNLTAAQANHLISLASARVEDALAAQAANHLNSLASALTGAAPAAPTEAPKAEKAAKPPKAAKAAKEPDPTTAAVEAAPWPLGGPIVEPLDLAEVKRRSILFMENPMGGGDRFATILASFAIKKISELPAAKYRAFVDSLMPESAAVEPGSGNSLLD